MGMIIDALTRAEQKGAFLELLVEDVFNDDNFSNVVRQKSGSQFGFDLIAYKNKECWKIECKNLRTGSRIQDIAQKLVWHIDNKQINRFVIVSPFGISNDLRLLLEQRLFYFPIEVWHGAYLERKIARSPRAMDRLCLDSFDDN